MKLQLICIAALLAVSACRRETPPVADAQKPDTIRTIVDSIFPVEEEIRRFKASRSAIAATELQSASSSRDALVKRFLAALEKRDTVDLRAMTLDAAEFIDLYYPTSIYSHPPYKQSPEIVWLLMRQNSEQGLRHTLDRLGGKAQRMESYACKPEPRTEDLNHFWDDCTIRFARGSAPADTALKLGPIIERAAQFKLLTFSNKQ